MAKSSLRNAVVEVSEPVEINEDSIGSADAIISATEPYIASMRLRGVADLLWHAWNCDAIEEKANARKGSAAKKKDVLEHFVYRNEDGLICVPATYLRGAMLTAARFKQDPRSPRKSAVDLVKAGVIPITLMAPLGRKWDYEHRGRVMVQRNGVTRTRPAFKAGWECSFDVQVLLPEYIGQDYLHELIIMAGKFGGFGDMRPTFGRFSVVEFKVR